MNLGGETPDSLGKPDPAALQLADRWILSRLARVNRETAGRYSSYGLGEAAKGLYEFAWNEVCDWYLELSKRRLNPGENPSAEALADQRVARQVLAQVMEELQRRLHPLMPHLSEELWHALTAADDKAYLALQRWPELDESALDEALEHAFTELFEAIRVVRNLRAVAGLKPSQAVPVRFITTRPDLAESLTVARVDIAALTRAESVEVMADAPPGRALAGVSGELQVLLPIDGLVDLDALKGRLSKDLAKAEKEIAGLQKRLDNPNFADKAPAQVVAECRANLAEAETQAQLARKRLADLS